MDTGEGRMNPARITMINALKEYWSSKGSNQQPHILKSYMLQTQLYGLGECHINLGLPGNRLALLSSKKRSNKLV